MRMGNPVYIGQCKEVRFKTIYIESLDAGETIPLMTNEVVNPNMDTLVDYVSTELNSYRSFTHDAIRIYGFGIKQTSNGAVKAKIVIKDGLRCHFHGDIRVKKYVSANGGYGQIAVKVFKQEKELVQSILKIKAVHSRNKKVAQQLSIAVHYST